MSSGASTAHETTGEFPQCWTPTTMGEIGRYLNGFAFNSKTWARSGRPIIRIQNLTGSGSEFNYFEGDIEERYIVRDGDLLFSWAATLGVFVWRGPEAVLNQHIFKVESRINSSFHRYLIEHKIAEMMQQTHGTGMVHITKKKFDAIPVYEPPLDEQEKIVEILEEQLSRLDAALDSVRAVREKSVRFRRSLLHAAFAGALTGHDTTTVELPFGWEEVQLGELADVGWGDLQVTKSSFIDSGFIAYSAAGPDGFREGFDFDQDGIVLSAIGAGCGRTWYAKGRWSCIKNTIRILEKSKRIKLEFLYQQLSDPNAWPKRGSGQPFISQKDARELLVKVPPLSEQTVIVQILEEQLSRLDASLTIADAIEKKASALRRSLLHAAFSGDLTKEWREGAHV